MVHALMPWICTALQACGIATALHIHCMLALPFSANTKISTLSLHTLLSISKLHILRRGLPLEGNSLVTAVQVKPFHVPQVNDNSGRSAAKAHRDPDSKEDSDSTDLREDGDFHTHHPTFMRSWPTMPLSMHDLISSNDDTASPARSPISVTFPLCSAPCKRTDSSSYDSCTGHEEVIQPRGNLIHNSFCICLLPVLAAGLDSALRQSGAEFLPQ